MDIKSTRITKYLTPKLENYIFDELSPTYLEKAGVKDIMLGVPVPIDKTDLSGISVLKLTQNMSFVLGCDPNFKYADKYIEYILKNFDERFADGLIAQGAGMAEKEDFEGAVIQFRAALQIDPENAEAYYCYGRGLKDCYEHEENDEEYIGNFKAEAMEAFETCTIKNPEFADAFYYLGYCYVNMGLYMKAKLTWDEYARLTAKILIENPPKDESFRKEMENTFQEIQDRLSQLEAPCQIEKGYNMILSGKYEDGIKVLKRFTDSEYKTWWPLWYYLATAYTNLGLLAEGEVGTVDDVAASAFEEAIRNHLEVLKLSPSNENSMEELIDLYSKLGNSEKVDKYVKKLEVVKHNRALDKEQKG